MSSSSSFGCGNEIYSFHPLNVVEQVRYSLEAAKLALSNVSDGVYDASAGMLYNSLYD